MSAMPPPELAYKPEYNFKIAGAVSIEKCSTMPSDKPEKPKKTLRKFNPGSRMRHILTKNVVIEFPSDEIVEEKSE